MGNVFNQPITPNRICALLTTPGFPAKQIFGEARSSVEQQFGFVTSFGWWLAFVAWAPILLLLIGLTASNTLRGFWLWFVWIAVGLVIVLSIWWANVIREQFARAIDGILPAVATAFGQNQQALVQWLITGFSVDDQNCLQSL